MVVWDNHIEPYFMRTELELSTRQKHERVQNYNGWSADVFWIVSCLLTKRLKRPRVLGLLRGVKHII